jgi:DHA3 family macrolide efflux protein-like MFS transporter
MTATPRAPAARRHSPYRPVLRHPVLRRVLPGIAVSCLGDGMSAVAVTWLAIQLAPPGTRGTWVALAVSAYTLPGALGVPLFGRLLAGRPGAQLAGWDAILRAVALGAIPVAYAVGVLSAPLYVVLLGVSSLLHSWGGAGRYALVAELLPAEQQVAANSVVSILVEGATIVGPPLAGLLVAGAGAASVIAVDAATYAVLAASYRYAMPARAGAPVRPDAGRAPAGLATIRRDRALVGLLLLSAGFFFLYGPLLVALPLYVVGDLHAGAGTLALFYAAAGVGSVLGGLLAGYLGRRRLWPIVVGIVVGWGIALVPLGLPVPVGVALVAFGVSGVIWAPYPAVSTALFQRDTPAEVLPAVLAARGAVLVLAVPLGTLAGAPLVAALGPRGALLACALAIVALGLTGVAVLLARRRGISAGAGAAAGTG